MALAIGPLWQQFPGFEWNKKSTLTAPDRVEFPGIVLEPGTYIVRLQTTGDRRSVVEVLNSDESQVLATVIAIPDHRVREDTASQFTFHPLQRAGPRPVKTWYFGSDLVGLEFVYPKARATQIARDCNNHVLAFDGGKDGAIVAVTPNGKDVIIDAGPAQTARQKPQ